FSALKSDEDGAMNRYRSSGTSSN
ncbi:hypothetical protein A2U01_0040332, partial [Trifolium medium]|nr:hypothetical protein [Trifolium medium]